MSPRAIVFYCGLLMTVGAFSIDSTLPAFPFMVRDFSTSYENVQLTVTVFMFFAAGGQLVVGALADRYGRKPLIVTGLLIYCAGALISAFSGSIGAMLAGRALQGLGAATGWVLARAILRDLYSGRDLARNMAFASAVFAFGPIMAPLLAAALMLVAPWPVIFILMLAFALSLLSVCIFRLPETIAEISPDSLRPRVWIGNAAAMLINPQSRFFLILSGVSHTMMLLIIVGLPRVYDESFGIAGPQFALFFGVHGLGIVAGQIVNRRLIARHGALWATKAGAAVLALSALVILSLALADWLNAYLLSALFVMFATCYLMVYSNSAALALDPHGRIAGFASSFFGFFSQMSASLGAAIFAPLVGGDPARFGAVMLALSAAVLVSLLTYSTRRRKSLA